VVIARGEVWWAELPAPPGSTAGYGRPVVVVQSDIFNQSKIETVICIPLTGSLKWEQSPGNMLVKHQETGLDRDSVAQTSLILAVDKANLTERIGHISSRQIQHLFEGLDLVLGRR
jgi:mRNA interferase MazF